MATGDEVGDSEKLGFWPGVTHQEEAGLVKARCHVASMFILSSYGLEGCNKGGDILGWNVHGGCPPSSSLLHPLPPPWPQM